MKAKEIKSREIVLAGGCFWGIQEYFRRIYGVLSTIVGYGNGIGKSITYEEVCAGKGSFAEVVYVLFDENEISLMEILDEFFKVIDPTSLNRQGNDKGIQYRTGVYSKDLSILAEVREYIEKLKSNYESEIVVEVLELKNFIRAEDYHQDYLKSNPTGYCHIKKMPKDESDRYFREKLSTEEYKVLKESGTDYPFSHEYTNLFEEGIYVDKLSGRVLFSSLDKFDSPCGWPAFTKSVLATEIKEIPDRSHNMERIEVRSEKSDIHLGHVFDDGPNGSPRYCINGNALKFIKKSEMERLGYGEYLKFFFLIKKKPFTRQAKASIIKRYL